VYLGPRGKQSGGEETVRHRKSGRVDVAHHGKIRKSILSYSTGLDPRLVELVGGQKRMKRIMTA